MNPFLLRRILHPTDFSASAGEALAHSLDLAARAGAALQLLHVVAGPRAYAPEPDLPASQAEALRKRLYEAAQARLAAFDQALAVDLTYELVEGRHAAPAILEHAARREADLVVLGTHGRRGLRHLFLGSVAEEVIRQAPCPALVVREQDEAQPPGIARILVPVDFSSYSNVALGRAKHLAALYGATLTLLFVAEEHVVPFFSDTGIPTFSVMKIDPDIIERAGEALAQLDASTEGPAAPTTYAVRSGQPSRQVVAYAREEDADLIVMATRGVSGVERGLIGSVTERVVRTAPCPVWTVNRALARQEDRDET